MAVRKLATWGVIAGAYACMVAMHAPLLRLPYFWDEAGYYIPAALDFYRHALLIPISTQPIGHTPLLSVYLGVVWHVLGFSPLVSRSAMLLVAAIAVWMTFELGRRVAERETGVWSALLLAISPLFFAQSSLAFLDLTVALFTIGAVLALLEDRWVAFAVAASLAEMSKETAVVLLPVAWVFVWLRRRERSAWVWVVLAVPLIPMVAWALYYHAKTGFWTGNANYLQYNLYSTLTVPRILRAALTRCEELFVGGFNWFLTLAAIVIVRWEQRRNALPDNGNAEGAGATEDQGRMSSASDSTRRIRDFVFVAAGIGIAYTALLSLVGGAILPRYMLPVLPFYFLVAVILILRAPKRIARTTLAAAGVAFVVCWFWNPPYPFPYEDNLAYADFVQLHQQAARFLQAQPPGQRILTAWPATNELHRPSLGYITKPLVTAAVHGFTPHDFANPPNFDLLYLYSRKWEPPDSIVFRSPRLTTFLERFYGYTRQVNDAELIARFHLKLIASFQRRGQWVRIYETQQRAQPSTAAKPQTTKRGLRSGPVIVRR
jgi:Dolichyl-phosphate-mannose-protein mannosyltransferase